MAKGGFKLRGNEKLLIIDVSDTHFGAEWFNEPYFFYFLDVLDAIKSQWILYTGGDLWEAASKKVGNSAFKTTMTLDEQLDYSLNYFKPYKKNMRFAAIGNHDIRLWNDFDFNITSVFAKKMKCEYGHSVIDEFNINGEPFKVYLAHGVGSAKHSHTAQGKFIRETEQIEADLFLNGHNHRLDFFSRPVMTSDGLKRQHYGFSGSFLGWKGYSEAMHLPILPEAFQVISINKDRVVKANQYYIDERRPDLLNL